MDDHDPDPRGGRDELPAQFPGAEALRGRSPREILHRLLDHDPFELESRTRAHIESLGYLVAPDRVWLRALARVAHGAMRYRGRPPIDAWLLSRIEQSLREILEEDLQAELDGEPLEPPFAGHLRFVAENFGLPLDQARRACIRFNSQPEEVRRTFFAITFARKSVARWIAEGNGPPERVREQLEQAARALSKYPDPDDFDLLDAPW